MANEQYIDGSGNIALQHIEQSTIDIHQYIGKSLEYKQLEERLSELNDLLAVFAGDPVKKQDYAKKVSEQEKMIAAFKADVLRLAGTFDNIELYSENLKLARQLFDEGKFREANAILSVSDLQEEQDELLQKKERTEKALRNNANAFLVKAQSTALDFDDPDRFALTCKYFESSLAADKNFDNLDAYIKFLTDHNKYSRAFPYCEEMVQLMRPGGGFPLAKALYHLGGIQFKWDELTAAGKSWREALRIILDIYNENKTRHFYYITVLLDALGVIDFRTENWAEAEKTYAKQIEIYEGAIKSDPEFYQFYLEFAQYSLLLSRAEQTPFHDIEPKISEFIARQRKNIGVVSGCTRKTLFTMLSNFLLLYHRNKKYPTALELSRECLDIIREETAINPEACKPDLASSLNRHAAILMETKQYEEALVPFREAAAILEKLVKEEREEFQEYYARSLEGVAKCETYLGHFTIAEEQFLTAIAIREAMAKKNWRLFLTHHAKAVKNYAKLKFEQEEFEAALEKYREAEAMYVELAKHRPQKYLPLVADCHFEAALCYNQLGELELAVAELEQCADIKRPFCDENPNEHFLSFGTCLYNIGVVYTRHIINRTKALPYLSEIIEKNKRYGFNEESGPLFDLITDTAVLLIIWQKRDNGEIVD